MKKIMNRFLYPSKKDSVLFACIQVWCVTVLWFISEKKSDYFVSGLFSFSALCTFLFMWARARKKSSTVG
jgi:hypothetical protein